MIEILRRFALVFGLCGACWLWLASPPVLISVRKPDFEREHKRRFAFHPLDDSLIGSGRITLEEYQRRALNSRKLPPPSTNIQSWLEHLDEALEGRGPEARRVSSGEAYYLPKEQPVAQWAPALQEFYRQGSWLNAYLVTGGRALEFFLHPEPRESKAPHEILYPQRGSAWPWALGGLLAYFLLPGRPRRSIRYDPIPIVVLDVFGAALIGFFWTLPLALYETNEAAAEGWLGGPVLSWLVAAIILALLMRNAANAAFALDVRADSVRVRGLLRSREIPYSRIQEIQALEDHGAQVGLKLRLEDGHEVSLPWSGVLNYSLLTDALGARRLDSRD